MEESLTVKPLSENLANANISNLGDLDLNDEVKAKLKIVTGDPDDPEHQEKKQKALKGMKKLLHISERYSAYCNDKIKAIFEQSEQERVNNMMKQKKKSVKNVPLAEIPYFKGILKDYQVVGVNWLRTLFEHGVNGILADEMGLGKTVQVIALICYLMNKINGPFLILVPLSTLPNWGSEFKRFAPEIPVVLFHGNKEDRCRLMHDILKIHNLNGFNCRPVVITTIYMLTSELKTLNKVTWKYLIIDEGQCIKNHNAQISRNVRTLKCLNRLILTGTPLQNNLTELWSLLNFIMPEIFKKIETFSSLFLLEDFNDNSKIVKEEETSNVIGSLHRIIQPFMLRRMKSDVLRELVPKKEVIVYCPLSALQRRLYMYTINANIAGLKGQVEEEIPVEEMLDNGRPKRKCIPKVYKEEESDDEFEEVVENTEKLLSEKLSNESLQKYVYNIKMQNPLMMFKKIVNHPYLVNMPVTPENTLLIDDKLITESGKMLVLDVMLKKLKNGNHKVLIFSTLVIMLDLIEELMIVRNHTYCRIDGSKKLESREESIRSFNNDPNIFAFLISTRAGGLGLNLVGADTVIIYDKDWNPQADIQAQDRCHRIGQTKPVIVYSLITKNTIDQKILNCGNMKKKLEKVIVKKGKFMNPIVTNKDSDLDLQELQNMLENDDSSVVIAENSNIFSVEVWDELLDRSALYDEIARREQKEKENSKKKN